MNPSVFDVALGMVFLFVVISLVCSAIQEFISQIFRLRAKNLEAGLANLLKTEKGDELVTALFNHPLIKGLSKEGQKPSYIPPNHFSLALLDIMTNNKGKLSPDNAILLKDFQESIFAKTDAGKSIILLISDAGNDAAKARETVESWFNASMDRVQGWYKRTSHNIIFVVALIVCVTLNIDSIKIAERLWADKDLSGAIASVAVAYSKSPDFESHVSKKASQDEDEVASDEKVADYQTAAVNAAKHVDLIKELKYPIGWQDNDGNWITAEFTTIDWLLKFMGIFVTIFAASFGAPFWFQLLNKVADLRSSGSPPATADDKKTSPKEI